MYTILIFEGDPTNWCLPGTNSATVAQQLSQGPVSLPVISPLVGDLIVSARAAGSVAILDVISPVSWVPSGNKGPASVLYVPSAAGPTAQFPGYELPVRTDVDGLEQDIIAAMQAGQPLATNVTTAKGSGVVMLDGATLPFAVICPVAE
jgi:hypothetical protein